jgi:beta-glucosidase
MDLPPRVSQLITAVLAAQPKAIVVTQSGTPFTMPWAAKATTLLHSWLGGNEVGTAIASVIFGAANPSGKLPLTFPIRIEDTPAFHCYTSDAGAVVYGEDIFVGYRWYEARRIEVAFPFSHGLSYTTFSISGYVLTDMAATVRITNTGEYAGAEVLMLYVSRDSPTGLKIQRPPRELKGFKKVFLEKGESKLVQIPIDKYTTMSWDRRNEAWVNEEGRWKVTIVAGTEKLSLPLVLNTSRWWNGL